MSLRAGVAVRDITPQGSVFLVGYPHTPRRSTGVHDPLLATALWIQDEGEPVVLVSLDLLFVHHDTVRACRRALERRAGVPESNLLISATHTHSGPVTASMLAWEDDRVVPPPDPAYLAWLESSIVEVVLEAAAAALPADLAWTAAPIRGVGGNRIDPAGSPAPVADVLVVRRAVDRSVLTVGLVYAMHPTVLHEDSTLISADFPGFARGRIEAALPGARVLYHTGPCGDQSPRHHVTAQTFDEAERLGVSLGEQILAAVTALTDGAFRSTVAMGSRTRGVPLPARVFPSTDTAESALREARERHACLAQSGAPRAEVRTAEVEVFGAEELVVLARAARCGAAAAVRARYTPAQVQVLRVGDRFIAGLPGELFAVYGHRLKRRPGAGVVPVSLANGELQGYIVTPEAEARGGYEAACSLFPPAAGDLLVEAARELIRELET